VLVLLRKQQLSPSMRTSKAGGTQTQFGAREEKVYLGRVGVLGDGARRPPVARSAAGAMPAVPRAQRGAPERGSRALGFGLRPRQGVDGRSARELFLKIPSQEVVLA
jgi:hypothetical protein